MSRVKTTPQLPLDVVGARARERALHSVQESVREAEATVATVEAVIPVDASGWEAVLGDAGIVTHVRELLGRVAEVGALDVNDPAVIGGALRRVLSGAAEVLARLIDRVEQSSWFVPPAGRETDRDALLRVPRLAVEVVTSCLETMTGTDIAASLEAWAASAGTLGALAEELADRPMVGANESDAVELVFGAGAEQFRDREGFQNSDSHRGMTRFPGGTRVLKPPSNRPDLRRRSNLCTPRGH